MLTEICCRHGLSPVPIPIPRPPRRGWRAASSVSDTDSAPFKAARQVLDNDTVDAPALMVATQILVALGESASAQEALHKLFAAAAPEAGARSAAAVLAARIAAHRGDLHEALELLSQNSTQAALALKGALFAQVGRYHDAIRVLREALREVPDSPDALGALGYAYAAVGSITKASRAMTAAAALDPTDRSAGLNLAALLISQDRASDAVATIDRLIGHHPNDIGLERSAASAMHSSGDTAGALRRLRRVRTSRAARNATDARKEELGLDILLLDTPPRAPSEVFAAAAAALRRCDYRSDGHRPHARRHGTNTQGRVHAGDRLPRTAQAPRHRSAAVP